MSTYRQMGYSSSTLENLGCILTEFNEATTVSLGDVVFLVQADSIIFNVHFLVIESLSLYNVIMEQVVPQYESHPIYTLSNGKLP